MHLDLPIPSYDFLRISFDATEVMKEEELPPLNREEYTKYFANNDLEAKKIVHAALTALGFLLASMKLSDNPDQCYLFGFASTYCLLYGISKIPVTEKTSGIFLMSLTFWTGFAITQYLAFDRYVSASVKTNSVELL